MAEAAGPDGGLYTAQLAAAAQLIAASGAPDARWDLVYCSRSGSPAVPWLEPDINRHLEKLAAEGVTDVIVVPVGFVSDHFEVLWDLDTEAAATAARLGLRLARTATPATDPRFVTMVRELVQERIDRSAPRRALSALGPSHDVCPSGCCRVASG
jgi:ferrochelatase